MEWVGQDRSERDEVPPYSINDLPDTKILTPEDFEKGVWLTANVWAGSAETRVDCRAARRHELEFTRTQEGEGESARTGAEYADPFATARQLSVARFALESQLGEERAQGFELFQGSQIWPGTSSATGLHCRP